MKVIILISTIYLILITNQVCGIKILNGVCLRSSNCGPTEYCDRDFPNPVGKCKEGYVSGKHCLADRYCASKKCSFFVCKGQEKIRDGKCEKKLEHTDCPSNQYCKKNDDDEYKCMNRKCRGFCKRSAECMSNKCHLFTCVSTEKDC